MSSSGKKVLIETPRKSAKIVKQKVRLSATAKTTKETVNQRPSVGPNFKHRREISSKIDSSFKSRDLSRLKNSSKTRESSKNNKLNNSNLNKTVIHETKNLKLDKKEIKVNTSSKTKKPPLNNSMSSNSLNESIRNTSQLKDILINLKKQLKDKEELNKNLQDKIKENENVISNLNKQVIEIRSQLAQRDANDLFEMDGLMEKLSSMENEKNEQEKKIKILTEQVFNYSSDIRKSVSSNEKLKIDIERYKSVITSLKEEKENFLKIINNLKKENEDNKNSQINNINEINEIKKDNLNLKEIIKNLEDKNKKIENEKFIQIEELQIENESLKKTYEKKIEILQNKINEYEKSIINNVTNSNNDNEINNNKEIIDDLKKN